MSGQLKEIRTRIKSVKSTQQITKAMKVVSAAKLRKAQDAIIEIRPYADKLTEMMSNIVAGLEGDVELSYAQERPIERVLLVAITSDKGLCGAFNANVIKLITKRIDEAYPEQYKAGKVDIMCLGKKANDFFKRRDYSLISDHVDIFQHLSFDDSGQIAEKIMSQFEKGEYDRIEVMYSRFKNAATQFPMVTQLLPIPKIETAEGEATANHNIDFIFEPDKHGIVEALVPKILKTQFHKFLLESNASEHGARMTAMDKATENAEELLGDLRLYYNRARQAAITTELTEIVSGAAALEG